MIGLWALAAVMWGSSPGVPEAAAPRNAGRPEWRTDAAAAIDEGARGLVNEGEPGMAILVVDRGRVVHARGYGLANLETGAPIDASTPFQLASVSKAMTAMAVMILAEEGALGYDDAVGRFLPEIAAHRGRRGLTVRHLLHHVSGIPDYLFRAELPPGRREESLRNADVVAWVAGHRKQDFQPGTRYAYSNTNYVLLAAIVERVAGVSFGDFMRDRVFRPAGMTTAIALDRVGRAPRARARGYLGRQDGFALDSAEWAIAGDACVYASLRDFVGWERALSSTRLVSRRTLELAFTPGRLRNGRSIGYGFGWDIEEVEGERVLSHGGAWEGYRTAIVRVPSEQLMVVVLANRVDIDAPDVAEEVARLQVALPARARARRVRP